MGGRTLFGAGEIADVVLLVVGIAALGGVAIEAGRELLDFGVKTIGADSEADLDVAAEHLANAIGLIGVEAVMVMLLRKKPKVFKHHYTKHLPHVPFSQMKPLPRSPGWFYKPKITYTPTMPAGAGTTNMLGDTKLGTAYTGSLPDALQQVKYAQFHESVHRMLTPKLQVFREFRVHMRMGRYAKSYLLRYLEEALAETYALARMHGIHKTHVLEALRFPLKNPIFEVSVAAMRAEVKGALIGTIGVGGSIYYVTVNARSGTFETVPNH